MLQLVPLEPVDYLVIGHVTEDLTPAGPRLGGTAAFSALTARALGLRVGIVTAAAPGTSLQALEGIHAISVPAEHTTAFENIEEGGERRQILHRRAARIPYTSVPEAWHRTPILHLGPLAQELDSDLPGSFSPSLLGLTPQGWLRQWDAEGRVEWVAWQAERLLSQAGAVILSRADVRGDEEFIEELAHRTRLLAVTEGAAGCVLYWNGDRRRFRPPAVEQVDATGAGDIFAAAFFVRLFTTRDPWEAARFATQLAARSVGRPGLAGIPTPAEIEECLMEVL